MESFDLRVRDFNLGLTLRLWASVSLGDIGWMPLAWNAGQTLLSFASAKSFLLASAYHRKPLSGASGPQSLLRIGSIPAKNPQKLP